MNNRDLQTAQASVAQAVGAVAAIPNDGVPRLRIRFEDVTGKQVREPIEIRVPSDLSLRVAKMHLLEMIVKLLKPSISEALKAMGFK